MKKLLFIVSVLLFGAVVKSNAQGCVAIRSNGNTCTLGKPGDAKGWQLNLNTRYFKSYKHFVGTKEQKEREEAHTEVINHSFSLDATLTRYLNQRWSVTGTLPFISNVRSSLYEHGGNAAGQKGRHSTQSVGIGDIRFVAYRWMVDPSKHTKANFQLGLGIKLPTGNYRYEDYFYKSDSTSVIGPVDQSIQLGDGGTGFITEFNGFVNVSPKVGIFTTLYYLINPMEQNGVSSARGSAPTALATQYFTDKMSVPDQYMARLGANLMLDKWNLSGGVRLEGIPSSDLIGGDKGFRRPGYVLSAEPVVSYTNKKVNYYISVPFALTRDRVQSFSDKLRTKATGTKVQGDAAFANYLINVGVSIGF